MVVSLGFYSFKLGEVGFSLSTKQLTLVLGVKRSLVEPTKQQTSVHMNIKFVSIVQTIYTTNTQNKHENTSNLVYSKEE